MKLALKIGVFVVLSVIYMLLASSLAESASYESISDFTVKKYVEEGSSWSFKYLNPSVEESVAVRAESTRVFAFSMGSTYFDSDKTETEGSFIKEFKVNPNQWVKLDKAASYVQLTLTSGRPIELTVHHQLFSSNSIATMLIFMEVIVYVILAALYLFNVPSD